MADSDQDGQASTAKAKSKKKLFILGGAALAAVIVGAGGYLLVGRSGGAHEDQAAAAEEKVAAHAPAPAKAAFLDLPEMTVNLATADTQKQRYVRLAIALEVDKPEMAEAIKPMMPRVLDSFQTHLRELRPEDIRGASGAYRLKEELLRRVNVAVAPARVEAVLFKDIVIQ